MSFNHRKTGTSETAWQQCQELADLSPLVLPDTAFQLLVLAAHPDDETLGAGGVIAMAYKRQVRINVIIASDGERSHPCSPTHSREQIGHLRRAEAECAVKTLAPSAELAFLGLGDGELSASRDVIAQTVRDVVTGPAWILTPWRHDKHPDHEVCARAAQTLLDEGAPEVRLLEYPIWAWHWGSPQTVPQPGWRRLELPEDVQRIKQQALDGYASQRTPLSDRPGDEPVLPVEIAAHFLRDFETYVETNASSAATPGYFEELYHRTVDPWGLATRFYEKRKRKLLMASLPRDRFKSAYEPGCATGELTLELAGRCETLLAADLSMEAVKATRQKVAGLHNVQVALQRIPHDWTEGVFDLIVLSEIAYYTPDIEALIRKVQRSLSDDGALVACHWRHPAHDHPYSAEAVHAGLGRGLHRLAVHVEEDFLLEVWSRQKASVADMEGIT